jgi:hypothetical protein
LVINICVTNAENEAKNNNPASIPLYFMVENMPSLSMCLF